MLFENPQFLLLLLIAPLLLAVGVIGHLRGRNRVRAFAKEGTWDSIRPYHSVRRGRIRFALLLSGFCLVALATSGPKFGTSFQQVQSRGLDMVIAIDTSDSMLAQDVRPDRLAFAKREIEKIVLQLKGDRVALLPFAGEAYLLCPLTLDLSAIKMFLGVIDTEVIPTGGTGIANAIEAARATFDKTERKYRVMILLTDGEDLLGKAAEAAEQAKDDGIVIFVMGIGTPEGVPIPVKDSQGDVAYKKDRSGKVVISKINEATLTKIARSTGGIYVRATYDDSAREAIFARIEKMERKELEGKLITRFKARYQYFLVPGILLLALGLAVNLRKRT